MAQKYCCTAQASVDCVVAQHGPPHHFFNQSFPTYKWLKVITNYGL